MKLRPALQSCDLETLRAIHAHWGKPGKAPSRDGDASNALYQRMGQDHKRARSILEELDDSALLVLNEMTIFSLPLNRDALISRTALEPNQVNGALRDLRVAGFCFPAGDNGEKCFQVPRIFRKYIEVSLANRRSYRYALLESTLSEVRYLATELGVPFEKEDSSEEIVSRLAGHVLRPKFIERAVNGLATEDLHLLSTLHDAGAIGIHGPSTPGSAFHRLVKAGLVLRQEGIYFVPKEVRDIIENGFSDSPRTERAKPTLRPWPRSLQQDLIALACHVQRHRPQVLKSGGIPRRILSAFSRVLGDEELIDYVAFLFDFGMCLDIFRPVAGTWRVVPRVPDELLLDERRLRHAAIGFWRDGLIPGASMLEGRAALDEETRARRTLENDVLIKALRSFDDWTMGQDIVRRHIEEITSRPNAAFTDPGYHRSMVLDTLDGLLRWCGLIVHGHLPGGDKAYRLLPEGPVLLADESPAPASSHTVRHLFVQPDATLIIPRGYSATETITVAAFSDVISVDAVITMRISEDGIRQTLDDGALLAEDLLDALGSLAAAPIPETVQRRFHDIGRRHGEIELSPGGPFIRTRDASLLARLRKHPQFKTIIGSEIAPGIAFLRPGTGPREFQNFARALEKDGYLPVVQKGMVLEGSGETYTLQLDAGELESFIGFALFASHLVREDTDPQLKRFPEMARRILKQTGWPSSRARTLAEALQRGLDAWMRQRVEQLLPDGDRTPAGLLSSALGYTGANPAREEEDIHELCRFALLKGLPVIIDYPSLSEPQMVWPSSVTRAHMTAREGNDTTERYYHLNRIKELRLAVDFGGSGAALPKE